MNKLLEGNWCANLSKQAQIIIKIPFIYLMKISQHVVTRTAWIHIYTCLRSFKIQDKFKENSSCTNKRCRVNNLFNKGKSSVSR